MAFVADTQNTLGKIIKKPKLTENLLNKPPFRFLHDIVSEVTNATGFAAGLFQGDETVAANIKDKESKVSYLNKIIDCVGIHLDTLVPARPLKIVAGLEAENTNVFLQLLAKAATVGDSSDAVRRVLAGEHQGAAAAAPPPAEKPRREERPPPEPEPARPPPKPTAEPTPQPAPAPAPAPREERKPKREPEPEPEADEPAREPEKPKRPPSARKQRPKEKEEEAAPPPAPAPEPEREEIQPPVAPARFERPKTAGRAPPKLPSNVVSVDKKAEPKPDKLGMTQALATGVIVEGAHADDDDDLIVEAKPDTDVGLIHATGDEKEHGALVRALLQEDKKVAGAVQEQKEEETSGIRMNRDSKVKDRKTLESEIQKLRDSIQHMCKNTNQLGKCMDYVQEDMDNMTKEYEHWKTDRIQKRSALEEQNKLTENTLEPLYSTIRELDEAIEEQIMKNNNVKAAVMKNDTTIRKLLKTQVRSK